MSASDGSEAFSCELIKQIAAVPLQWPVGGGGGGCRISVTRQTAPARFQGPFCGASSSLRCRIISLDRKANVKQTNNVQQQKIDVPTESQLYMQSWRCPLFAFLSLDFPFFSSSYSSSLLSFEVPRYLTSLTMRFITASFFLIRPANKILFWEEDGRTG